MPLPVVMHRLAKREVRDAQAWHAARSIEAPRRFKVAIEEALDRIASAPDALPELADEFRYVRVTRFPYMLVFERSGTDTLVVVALAHTSRRPGYRRRRKTP
jgi:plasmid stabilization system protein ParE